MDKRGPGTNSGQQFEKDIDELYRPDEQGEKEAEKKEEEQPEDE